MMIILKFTGSPETYRSKNAAISYDSEDIDDEIKAATTEEEKRKIIYTLGYINGSADLYYDITDRPAFDAVYDNKTALDELRKIQKTT